MSVLAFLGNATSQIVEPVLRDIGRTIRQAKYEEQRRVSQKELEKPVAKEDKLGYNEFSTLIRENDNSEGEIEDGTDLPPQGGLSVPEPDHREQGGDHREIQDVAQDIPEGTPEELVSEHDVAGKLNRHLMEIEKAAQERMEALMDGLLMTYSAPDKEADQMKWTAHMNMLTAMAEETVLTELVYS